MLDSPNANLPANDLAFVAALVSNKRPVFVVGVGGLGIFIFRTVRFDGITGIVLSCV